MAEPLQKIIAEPLRRAQPAGDAGAARRRPRSAVVGARDRDPRAHLARAEGARRAGDGRARARLRAATTSTSPAARGACSRIAEAHGRRDRARPRLAARRAGGVWRHQRRSNRANIGYHYDVSNAFYRLWLDPRMVYSCAYFRDATPTRSTTRRRRKLDHICRKLRLAPGERFLDIGCGWGALLFRAARALRRRGDRHHAVAEPVRARDAARSPRAGSPAACASSCATTSTCPRTRSTTRSRASACSSTSASRAFRSISARSTAS